MAVESAFYRLSGELLSMIIQQEAHWSCDTLKNLRLVHPRFAYLSDLLQKVFSQVEFSASPLSLQRFSSTRMDGVAPYIKDIEFGASIYTIDIPREQFFTCAREQAKRISLPRAGKAFPDWINGIPEGEIENAYQKYAKLHGEAVGAIDSGRAVSILTKALKSFGNARSIHLGHLYHDYNPHRDGNTIEGAVLSEQISDRTAWPSRLGDGVLKLAVKVLAQSGVRPVELNIAGWTSGLEPWDMIPGWDDLDLSEIKELTFIPELHGNYCMDEDVEQESRRSRVASGCSGLIAKAAHRLEHLHLGTLELARGSHIAKLDTPNLRSIDLSWTSFDARSFSQWLHRCHSLEELTMERTNVIGPRRSWRILFQAIREMPNSIIFSLNEVELLEAYGDIYMCCDTSKKVDYAFDSLADLTSGEGDEEFVHALEAFLSGSAEWSPRLDLAMQMVEEDEI